MGVPSFFRWLADKYPKVVLDAIIAEQPVLGDPNPNGEEYDCLYLDMNGLIHPACHPEEGPQPRDEDEMIEKVFEYIDKIFAIVRPRKLLYMAIDGVAPRAKMNQQRSRRFKSAKEIEEVEIAEEELRKKWEDEGKAAPAPKKRWDHNAITPGTEFMHRLSKGIQYYINKRITYEPAWSNINVLFSDASVPGEGEHKIMNFIRLQRAQPGYDPNIKHVLYGMDADLIMLGLATHEIHFNIIRETVVFKGKQTCSICGKKGHLAMSCQGKASTEDSAEQVDSPFQFLKLSILREYLRTELLVQDTQFPWDSERAIDDFVFLCFFVGNDFLPHLPSLEIREGALDDLIILYKRLMASSKGYLTNHGVVDLQLTNVLLKELSQLETRIFRKRKKDQESYERYKSKNEATPTKQETQTGTIFSAEENQKQASLLKRRLEDADTPNAKRSHSENIHESDDTKDVPLDEPEVLVEVDPKAEEPFASDLEVVGDYASDFKSELKKELEIKSKIENVVDDVDFGTDGWKVRYYTSKFGFQDRHIFDKDPEFMKISKAYIEGLCWVLLYYYKGCPSWGWYYPYHYAPFASDLYDLGVISVEFEKGQPFSPLSQLMGVLPTRSGHLVPAPYRQLMSVKESPILDFYPLKFSEDLNGKKYSWQAIALLPFIDESRLLIALKDADSQLTLEEKERDEPGFDFLYVGLQNSLANDISALYLKYQNVESSKLLKKRKLLSPSDSRGLFGYIAPYPNAILPVNPVLCIVSYVPPIDSTRCISSAYFDPLYREHLCFVHPEANPPPPVLTEADFATVSSTKRFGGRSILKLDSLYGSNAVQYAPGYPKNPSDRRYSNGSGRRNSGDGRYSHSQNNYDPYRSSSDRYRQDNYDPYRSQNVTDFRNSSYGYSDNYQQHGYSRNSSGNQYSQSYDSRNSRGNSSSSQQHKSQSYNRNNYQNRNGN